MKRVLIVGDVDSVASLVQKAISRYCQGVPTDMAENGARALEILGGVEKPDLIVIASLMLMDMPIKQLIQRINEVYPNIPVILTSSYEASHDGVTYSFLKKPFTVDDLLNMVKKLTEKPPANVGSLS